MTTAVNKPISLDELSPREYHRDYDLLAREAGDLRALIRIARAALAVQEAGTVGMAEDAKLQLELREALEAVRK